MLSNEATQFTKMPFSAWRYLEELGMPLELLQKMQQLGFVLAGTAAAALVEVAHGCTPSRPPQEFLFIYKGLMLAGPATVPDFQRTAELYSLLLEYGKETALLRPEESAIVLGSRKAFPGSPLLRVDGDFPDAEGVPWGENLAGRVGVPVSEQVSTGSDSLPLRIALGSDRIVVRYGTLQAQLLTWLQERKSIAQADLCFGDPVAYTGGFLDSLLRAHDARQESVPTWHAFDFTLTSAELDGGTLLYHQNLLEDLKAKRLRFRTLGGKFTGLASRVTRYREQGYDLDAVGLLELKIRKRSQLENDLAPEVVEQAQLAYDKGPYSPEFLAGHRRMDVISLSEGEHTPSDARLPAGFSGFPYFL